MHDIWNPWHGCRKCSEGCENCYMYYLDAVHGNGDSSEVKLTSSLTYPLSRTRDGKYRIKSGEKIRVCLTSDFFIEEADGWRGEAWEIMRMRPDVLFCLLTKRPERVERCLPKNWGDGDENVMLSVTAENQRRADERVPILLSLPFRHKGVMTAPLIGSVSLSRYLKDGAIEEVLCGGENYGGARVCEYDWVKTLYDECRKADVTFCFIETGTKFRKDGKLYTVKGKPLQSRMAYRSGLQYQGKKAVHVFTDTLGLPVPEENLYKRRFKPHCETCPGKLICNGCSFCGRCEMEDRP